MNTVSGIVLRAGMVFERRWRKDRMGFGAYIALNNSSTFPVVETFIVEYF